MKINLQTYTGFMKKVKFLKRLKIFILTKKIKKRYVNYYKNNQKLIKIWDYKFSTNNFGLVQKFDLDVNKKSILFLGDLYRRTRS